MRPSVICTICARGGSKGVKSKNTRMIAGLPLIAHTIEQAKASGLFGHIVVSTDSDALIDIARAHGAEVFFKRPAELAQDTTPKIPVIRHALQECEKHYGEQFPYLMDLDATSPLRTPEDIRLSFEQFLRDDNDVLVTAAPARRSPYFNLIELSADGRVGLSKKLEVPVARRQDSPKCFDMNASIYIWKREILLSKDTLFLEKTGLYTMPEERSIDIDSELDFEIVEHLLHKRTSGA